MYVILISFIRRGVINISSNNQFSFFSAGERTEQNISDTFNLLSAPGNQFSWPWHAMRTIYAKRWLSEIMDKLLF